MVSANDAVHNICSRCLSVEYPPDHVECVVTWSPVSLSEFAVPVPYMLEGFLGDVRQVNGLIVQGNWLGSRRSLVYLDLLIPIGIDDDLGNVHNDGDCIALFISSNNLDSVTFRKLFIASLHVTEKGCGDFISLDKRLWTRPMKLWLGQP